MTRANRWVAAGLMIMTILAVAGCQKTSASVPKEQPAEVKKVDGSELSRVTLTERAMERLDVKTDKVIDQKGPRKEAPQKSVPYSALLYDTKGKTWVYTSPESRVFVRQPVVVDYIDGDQVYLVDGPAAGVEVATRAVAELYGTETKFGN